MGPAAVSALVLGVALVVRHPATPLSCVGSMGGAGRGLRAGRRVGGVGCVLPPPPKAPQAVALLSRGLRSSGKRGGLPPRAGWSQGRLPSARPARVGTGHGLRLQQLGLCTSSFTRSRGLQPCKTKHVPQVAQFRCCA
eukprot:SAG25_NODE_414_length_8276_cov_29.934939_6_plen_138_part_00